MSRPRRAAPTRRGVILLVVLALLALFALVGLTFVFYAGSQADAARIDREGHTLTRPDVEPELLLALFLGQLLYDVPDDESGVYSALRGHSLARSLYGFDDAGRNDLPFNGTGRLHYPSPFAALDLPGTPPEARDDFHLVNYTFFRDDPQMPPERRSLRDEPQLPPHRRFLRDPERLGSRSGLAAARGPFAGGFNAPYTYPDLNNLYLAAVKADGTVLLPSFHRPWLFGPNDPGNPNWTNAAGKYLLLRPRPLDMGPGFPYPDDAGGDVKNLIGAPGGNDSYWIDLDAAVRTAPDGRKFKPLFAPLMIDLDSRVNVNIHGNVRGRGDTHASNMGLGPWEVNPRRLVLADPTAPGGAARRTEWEREWANLLVGQARPGVAGRYGGQPWAGRRGGPGLPPANVAPPLPSPHFYSPVDFDGCDEGVGGIPTLPIRLPGFGAPLASCFPLFPAGYGGGSSRERTDHPLVYNVFKPAGDDRVFAPSHLEALLRHGDTGADALTSVLLRLCPKNFAADPAVDPAGPQGAARRRRLVTTTSCDLNRPGIAPWAWDPGAQPYKLAAGSLWPRGATVPFPTLLPLPAALPLGSEFGPDFRAVSAALGRVDVNRPLAPYPAPDLATGRIIDLPGFLAAQDARVRLARDVYDRLRRAAGAADPAAAALKAAAGAAEEFNALRWLAQLAVNVVDYVDGDDYVTPFDWFVDDRDNRQWVFGTELPRLVVNEVYAEVANDPADRGLPKKAERPFQVNFWVELHNPFFADPSLSDGGAARLQVPPTATESAYAVYRLVLAADPNRNVRQPEQVLGYPDPGNTLLLVARYDPEPPPALQPAGGVDVHLVQPAGGRSAGPNGSNDGFYVLGPRADFPGTAPGRAAATLRVRDQASDGFRSALTYELPNTTPLAAGALPEHALFLQRLACPHLPPNPALPGAAPDPNRPFNPYVTVDYVERLPTNDGVVADDRGPRADPGRRPRFIRPGPALRRALLAAAAATTRPAAVRAAAAHVLPPQRRCGGPHAGRPDAPGAVRLAGPPRPAGGQPDGTAPGLRVQTTRADPTVPHRRRPVPAGRSVVRPGGAAVPGLRVPGNARAGGRQCLRARRARPRQDQPQHGLGPGTAAGPVRPAAGQQLPRATPVPAARPRSRLRRSRRPPDRLRADATDAHPAAADGRRPRPRRPPLPRVGRRPHAARRPVSCRPRLGGHALALLRGDRITPPVQPPPPPPDSPDQHPYLQHQLLTKLFNNVTARSNVFAVWLTVGFFEVTDDFTRPVQLGREIGRAEGRHVRHRLFAIVDRSPMTVFSVTAETPVPAAGVTTVTLAATSGISADGRPWEIQPGSVLAVGEGGDEETVVVTGATATSIMATFTRPHPAGAPVRGRGNPGPCLRWDQRGEPEVVPYFSVIE